MSEPDDKLPWDELIDQWLAGSLFPDQQAELAAWLKDHSERMQSFVEASVREQMLCDAARGVLVSDEVHDLTLKPHTTGRRSTMRSLLVAAVLQPVF